MPPGPGKLKREFPHVPLQQIDDLVDALALTLVLAARFDDFVPLLAHRHARERQLEESHATGLS
jgi:hypothetical protein